MTKTRIRVPKVKEIHISLSKDSLAQYALFMFLCSEALRKIFGVIIGSSTIGTYITIGLIYLPVVFILLKGKFRAYDFIVLWLMIAVAFGASYLLYPDNAYYFTRPTYGVLYRVLRMDRPIYGYLFIRLCNDKKRILSTLKVASYCLMVYYVITLLKALSVGYWMEYNGSGVLVQRDYSLVFGYNCILPTIVFLYNAFWNNKIKYYVMAAIGAACIILGGSRGALICLAVFVLLFLLTDWKRWSKNRLFVFFCLVGVAFCAFLGLGGGSLVVNLLKSSGIESRTIEKLLEGTISDDNGRDTIWAIAIDMIKKSGFWGYGLYGDRPAISSFHYAGYCHNIFLEILVNFGVPIGSVLIALMLFASAKMLFFCDDEDWRNLFLIFFSCSCELLLSMSFWYVSYFWLAFGVGACYYKEHRVRRLEEKRRKKFRRGYR